MDPAVMQAVVTPKGIMAMAVVDVSRNQPHFLRFFFPPSMFLSDGSQGQKPQDPQKGCTSDHHPSHFSSFI